MRTIVKGPEPATLTQHRQRKCADYENYEDKVALRAALVAEQRGLCCYCQSRIRPTADSMKIEHWQCQTAHPARQLDYANLHAACLGGECQPEHLQHCDTKKANTSLCFSVSDQAHPVEQKTRFLGDGRISAHDAAIAGELESVLNLNLPRLVSNRKAVLDAFHRRLRNARRVDPSRELPRWDGTLDGDLPEFAQVVVYWLRKRLARESV